jgi:hypothetical protein
LKIETSVKPGDPRNILPRSDAFLSVLGPYISAIEHLLMFDPTLVKGLSVKERDMKLKFLTAFRDFFEIDYARYDLCVSSAYLNVVEYQFFCTPFMGDEHWLYRYALRLAMTTFGVSELGMTYHVEATRCSGDAHTSIGNGKDNGFNMFVALEPLPEGSYHFVSEGDDCTGGFWAEYHDQVIYNLHIIQCLGFQLKLDIFSSIDQLSFCGRFITENRGSIETVCDIKRSLAKMHTICSDGNPEALTLAKMISYYHNDGGTPIIGVFATVLVKLLVSRVNRRQLTRAVSAISRNWWEATKLRNINFFDNDYPFVEISPEKRALVALRCGFSPAMQLRFEAYYKSFLNIGFIPNVIDRIPDDWNFDENSQVYGPVSDYVC